MTTTADENSPATGDEKMYDFANLWNDAARFEALPVPNAPELFGAALRAESGEKLAIRGLANVLCHEIKRGTTLRAPLPALVSEALDYLVESSADPAQARKTAERYLIRSDFAPLAPSLASWLLADRNDDEDFVRAERAAKRARR